MSTSPFYLRFFYFDTHYQIIARCVAVQRAELVRVAAFTTRPEEEEEGVALAERGRVAAMRRAGGEKGEGGGRWRVGRSGRRGSDPQWVRLGFISPFLILTRII